MRKNFISAFIVSSSQQRYFQIIYIAHAYTVVRERLSHILTVHECIRNLISLHTVCIECAEVKSQTAPIYWLWHVFICITLPSKTAICSLNMLIYLISQRTLCMKLKMINTRKYCILFHSSTTNTFYRPFLNLLPKML